jgi:hypothetical protein
MQQVYGMKVIVLNLGGLTGRLEMLIRTDNPYSDVWLSGQESAEAIVPEGLPPNGKGRTLNGLLN